MSEDDERYIPYKGMSSIQLAKMLDSSQKRVTSLMDENRELKFKLIKCQEDAIKDAKKASDFDALLTGIKENEMANHYWKKLMVTLRMIEP